METWMNSLGEEFGRKPMDSIFLPGTHNSPMCEAPPLAYDGYTEKPFLFVNAFRGWSGIEYIVKHTALNHELDVKAQLAMGIRALDVRLTYDRVADEIYCSHTFLGPAFRVVAMEVAAFLETRPSESVVMELTLDYETNGSFDGDAAARILAGRDFEAFRKRVFTGVAIPSVAGAAGWIMLSLDDRTDRSVRAAAPGVFNFPILSDWNTQQHYIGTLTKQIAGLDKASSTQASSTHRGLEDPARGFRLIKATITPTKNSVILMLAVRLTWGLATRVGAAAAILLLAMSRMHGRGRVLEWICAAAVLCMAVSLCIHAGYPVHTSTIKRNARECQSVALDLLGDRSAVISTDFPTSVFVSKIVDENRRRLCGPRPAKLKKN